MNLLRRIASLPGLRRVLLHPPVRRFLASVLALRFLLAARRTTTPRRFLWRELTARGTTHDYTIRATGVPVVLQHGRDLEALFELFERGEYEPPSGPLVERLSPGRVDRILDVGANVGMFSAWASGRWPGADIVAFEPSGESAPLYRRWLGLSGARAELVEAAAAPAAGRLTFAEGQGGGSHVVAADEANARSVPAVDLFGHLPGADLVKIDIEGSEWPILTDPRLADLRSVTLVLEYHRLGAPRLPAGEAARDLLEAAGFAVRMGAQNHWGHGIAWAYKD